VFKNWHLVGILLFNLIKERAFAESAGGMFKCVVVVVLLLMMFASTNAFRAAGARAFSRSSRLSMGLYDHSLEALDGTSVSLKKYEGKPVVVVNSATL